MPDAAMTISARRRQISRFASAQCGTRLALASMASAAPHPTMKEVPMNRVLVIDQDSAATHTLGLACLQHGVGAMFASNVCEGVRVLLDAAVDVVVLDVDALRLTPREMVTLFDRVAPGVPVVVAVRPQTALEVRVALELAGFRVLTKPVSVEELLAKAQGV
jgi:DNA-binding response OmpR family regulator